MSIPTDRAAQRLVPDEIRERLLNSFTAREASLLIAGWRRDGYPGSVRPGDPFGTVLAWLWRDDPDRAVDLLGEFVAMLRGADDVAPATLGVDELLAGLRMAVPPSFPDGEYAALVERARTEVRLADG